MIYSLVRDVMAPRGGPTKNYDSKFDRVKPSKPTGALVFVIRNEVCDS